MPWKFLVFLVFLAIVILFAGINVANSSDINLGFHEFEDVPIFVGLGSAYMLGAVSILPFALTKAFSKRRKLSSKYKERNEAEKQKYQKKASKKAGKGTDAPLLADSTGSGSGAGGGADKTSNETVRTSSQASAASETAKTTGKRKGLFGKRRNS